MPADGPPQSHPPSEPRPDKRAMKDMGAGYDRPARLQMVVALLLGLVLVAIPLYLWRRPRVETPLVAVDAEAPAMVASAAPDAGALAEDAGGPLALGEAKVLECHDRGPTKTAPDQCDRLTDFEKLFAKAIQDAASCAPPGSGGGLVPYVADVSFQRKRSPIRVMAEKDGRTLRSAKAVAACTAAIKKNLASAQIEAMKHEHARYKIAVTASYPAK